MNEILQADIENRGLILDPRTKLALIVTICIFVIGGVGVEAFPMLSVYLGILPILLLCTAKQWKKSAVYGSIYLLAYVFSQSVFPLLHGTAQSIGAVLCIFILRITPGIIMGAYLLASTTVSEFIAAMERMHMPDAITIPMAVMFRLFPTVLEEFAAINVAMKMREIYLGGKHAGKMVEYRIIPLLICSVNIGNELSQAALTRGLGGSQKRTNICNIGFHIQDGVLFFLTVLPYCLWIAVRSGGLQ